ncbi:MAG: carbohydrate ABC transporter permease, partial [Anaerolineae bacterium]|nr:carbohydrate ABC transporter permease [Anaerolineae bacterium]
MSASRASEVVAGARAGQAAAPYARRQRQWGILAFRYAGKALLYLIVLSGGLFLIVPFVWMLSASLKTEVQMFASPPVWIPNPIRWENYPRALTTLPFHLFLRNTLIVTALAMVGELLTCSMVAYAFARLRFPGKGVLFMLVLSTMMIPFYVVMIPRFILFRRIGWINTLLPLTVPAYFGGSPFYIFLFRQFFMRISFEMEDSARI